MAPGARADLCHTPAASLDAPLQLERPKSHCGGLATRLHRGKRRNSREGVGRARGTVGKSLSRCYTNMAPGVGRVHPVPQGSRQSFARSCTPPTSSKVSTINYGKSEDEHAARVAIEGSGTYGRPAAVAAMAAGLDVRGAFPHRPISSKAAAPRRPKHNQQTRRKPRHRHPRLTQTQNQGAFPHRPISSKAAAPRRQKHNQQTRRKPRHRHPRLEKSPKPTRNPLP